MNNYHLFLSLLKSIIAIYSLLFHFYKTFKGLSITTLIEVTGFIKRDMSNYVPCCPLVLGMQGDCQCVLVCAIRDQNRKERISIILKPALR